MSVRISYSPRWSRCFGFTFRKLLCRLTLYMDHTESQHISFTGRGPIFLAMGPITTQGPMAYAPISLCLKKILTILPLLMEIRPTVLCAVGLSVTGDVCYWKVNISSSVSDKRPSVRGTPNLPMDELVNYLKRSERKQDRETVRTERQSDRETVRQRDSQTERQSDRETVRQRDSRTERVRQRDSQTERQSDRETQMNTNKRSEKQGNNPIRKLC